MLLEYDKTKFWFNFYSLQGKKKLVKEPHG